MNKICVYTCITGDYDNLKEIIKEKGIDYYCFTNNKKIKSNSWNVIYISDNELSNVKLARKIKILGHEKLNDYDILLWMDAAVSFKKEIKDFINFYLDDEHFFVAFKHGVRSNIKDEAFECVKLGKETKENAIKLLEFYKKEDYPDNNGLIESTVFIRRKNEIVDNTMKLWFDMILNYSHRDQLSFNYCIYKTNLDVKWIDEKVFDNDWFSWERHNEERIIKKYRLYFGKDDYDLNLDFYGNYEIKNNVYTIKIKIPDNVNSFLISPCRVRSTLLKEIKINGKVFNNFKTLNIRKIDDVYLFYDENPFIIIEGDFRKGDNLKIELIMDILSENDLVSIIEKICLDDLKYDSIINEKNNQIQLLSDNLNLIYNGKFWKLKEKIKKIIKL